MAIGDQIGQYVKQVAPSTVGRSVQEQLYDILGGKAAPVIGLNEAPGYEGHYGYDPHMRAVGVVDGKIEYNPFQQKVYTGNDKRESFQLQDWSNPEWVTQMAQAGKLSLRDVNGKQTILVDPSIINDPNFSTKMVDQYRDNTDRNGIMNNFVDMVGKVENIHNKLDPFDAKVQHAVLGDDDQRNQKIAQALIAAGAYFTGGALSGAVGGTGGAAAGAGAGTAGGVTAGAAGTTAAATAAGGLGQYLTLGNALSAYNALNGIKSGNIGQALSGVLGFGGAGGLGGSLTNSISGGLSQLGVPSSLIPYLSKGLLSAGTTGLSGGNLQQSLTNGLATGAGAFGGNQVAGALGQTLPNTVRDALSQAFAGSLGSAIKGGNVGQAAWLSGLNGAISGAGKDFAPAVDNGISSIGNFFNGTSSSPNGGITGDNTGSVTTPNSGANKMGDWTDFIDNMGGGVSSGFGDSWYSDPTLVGGSPSTGNSAWDDFLSGSTYDFGTGQMTGGSNGSGGLDLSALLGYDTSGLGGGSSGAGDSGTSSTISSLLKALIPTNPNGSTNVLGGLAGLLAAYQASKGNKGTVQNNANVLGQYQNTDPSFNSGLSALTAGTGHGIGATPRTMDSFIAPSWYPKAYNEAFAPGGAGTAPTGTGGAQQLARGGLARVSGMQQGTRQNRLVEGSGGGQDDEVQARLSPGEYIMDADTVSSLGDGSNSNGAEQLDKMRQNIRTHKRSAPASKIPPKAKSPLAYLQKGAR